MEEEILEEINKNNESSNEIIEINEIEEESRINENVEELLDNKVSVKKEKKPSKWHNLSKKQKILIIGGIVFLLLLVISLLLYFLVFKKGEKEQTKKPHEPLVIVEKDNYRYEDGKLILKNADKKELGEYECTNQDEDKCYVAYYYDEDKFDVLKKVYEDGTTLENRSDILLDRYAFIYDNKDKLNEQVVLYDISEKKVIEKYKYVKELKDNLVIVKNDQEKYGILKISEEGITPLVDFAYDYLGYITDRDKIVAMNNLDYYLLDMSGNKVTKNIPGEIKNFDDKYLSVLIDKEYYIYDYNGIKAIDKKFDYIDFNSGYVTVVLTNKAYVYDNELNALNIEGIKLSNKNYVPKVTFDKDKKEIKREQAYTIMVNKDNVSVEYSENEYKLLNIYEGKLSSKQEYISYYDGVLYIYSDKEKNNLLGSYTCSNKNVVEESTTEYTSCYIAHEKALLNRGKDTSKIGYLPIYNNRYVFIQDGIINLWDLKGNTKKANYTEVDAGYYNNENKVNFVETANNLVMAKSSKSNNYGLIRIENSSITGVLPFENESISYLKENLLVKKGDGSYNLVKTNGDKITTKGTNYEITDYNSKYMVVKGNDNFMVYTFSGSMIPTSNLKYIALYEEFFVGITNSNVLEIHKYDETKEVKEEGPKVLYTKDLSKSYNLKFNGTNITLEMYDENGDLQEPYYVKMTFGDDEE